jgi:prepilin-type N-terminal cleavage/methylation domain-containing protein
MKATSTQKRAEQGFSLIELVVAMALLAVALTAVYRLQAKNLDLHAEARFVTLASQMAKARLAGITCREELVEGSESGLFTEEDGFESPYAWKETIREVPEHEGLFQVTVRVFLQNPAGEISRAMAVDTLCYRFRKDR